MMWKRVILLFLWICLFGLELEAQDLPPCGERHFLVEFPRIETLLWCMEQPIQVEDAGEMAFTALVFGDDNILYATRPLYGELYAIVDSDGDSLLDRPTRIAEGLRLPNGLAFADGILYVIGDGIIYRYAEGEISVLVDDLPHGRGFMASAITIHDQRIYAGIPFPCDYCLPDDELQGTVLSFALDGSDQQIIARGLRYPAALAFYNGALWVNDTARDGLRDAGAALDELNRIDLASAEIPHFGFPFCYGLDNSPDMQSEFDCSRAVAPTIAIETHSTPLAMLPYTSDTFRFIQDRLLIVFGGSFDNSDIRGYALYSLDMLRDDRRIEYEALLPADKVIANDPRSFYNPEDGLQLNHATIVNRRGAGIWPHRAYSIAVSPEGWLYISIGGGRILVFRTGDYDACATGYRDCD